MSQINDGQLGNGHCQRGQASAWFGGMAGDVRMQRLWVGKVSQTTKLLHDLKEALRCGGVVMSQTINDRHKVLAATMPQGRIVAKDALPLADCVVDMNYPLLIDNLFIHPLRDRLGLAADQTICSYLGVPVSVGMSSVSCTLSVADASPREWQATELGQVLRYGTLVRKTLFDA